MWVTVLTNAPQSILTLWKVTDLIAPPDLNQARVNKCLIALVNRKVVNKENSTVCIIFIALK